MADTILARMADPHRLNREIAQLRRKAAHLRKAIAVCQSPHRAHKMSYERFEMLLK